MGMAIHKKGAVIFQSQFSGNEQWQLILTPLAFVMLIVIAFLADPWMASTLVGWTGHDHDPVIDGIS